MVSHPRHNLTTVSTNLSRELYSNIPSQTCAATLLKQTHRVGPLEETLPTVPQSTSVMVQYYTDA